LVAAEDEYAVVLDLFEVHPIDAEGLRVLSDVIRSVSAHGGLVAISRPWRIAKSILGLVGTEGLVYVALSLTGAVAWLSQTGNGAPRKSEPGTSPAATETDQYPAEGENHQLRTPDFEEPRQLREQPVLIPN
jgi:hypothetical protein